MKCEQKMTNAVSKLSLFRGYKCFLSVFLAMRVYLSPRMKKWNKDTAKV